MSRNRAINLFARCRLKLGNIALHVHLLFPWPDMPGIWAIISEWFISGAPATVGSRSMFVRRLYRLACRRLRNALSNPSLDLLIHIGRQHSDQRHHPHHRGGPPRSPSSVHVTNQTQLPTARGLKAFPRYAAQYQSRYSCCGRSGTRWSKCGQF